MSKCKQHIPKAKTVSDYYVEVNLQMSNGWKVQIHSMKQTACVITGKMIYYEVVRGLVIFLFSMFEKLVDQKTKKH